MSVNYLTQDLAVVAKISPQLKDNGAVNSDWVDTSKYNEVVFVALLGATDITTDAIVQQSADSTGGTPTTIKSATQLGATDDNKQVVFSITHEDLTSGQRYVSCKMTAGDGTLGSNISCVGFGGNARYNPASDGDLASVAQIL